MDGGVRRDANRYRGCAQVPYPREVPRSHVPGLCPGSGEVPEYQDPSQVGWPGGKEGGDHGAPTPEPWGLEVWGLGAVGCLVSITGAVCPY